ncbi:hypothetical protein [Motilimonas eburnea]|uniref:hypothetical protein n=1 Tax=Motilimonas eburnea TaxID=1737488 RepID=UPI001E6564AD|nr:hypothetical protein [Motilimonas eburnea]MCE2571798.1 hypothetical protein [Motilimonas eburnea]
MKASSIIAGVIALTGLTAAQATTVVESGLSSNIIERYTLKQQKEVFEFSRTNASFVMDYISSWKDATDESKEKMTKDFLARFTEAVSTEFSNKDINVQLLLSQTIGNAHNLLLERNQEQDFSKEITEIHNYIQKIVYEHTGKLVITEYAATDTIWPQHGAHFPNKVNPDPDLFDQFKNYFSSLFS